VKNPYNVLLFSNEAYDIEIWLVDGKYVRTNIDEEFIGGGHHYRYDFIPENEIWIEDNTREDEIINYLIHELHERHLMKHEGLEYDAAHEKSSEVELYSRHYPEEIRNMLEEELADQD
jgi:hypothetical protein